MEKHKDLPPPLKTRSRAPVNPLPSSSSSNSEVTSSSLENNRVGAVRDGEKDQGSKDLGSQYIPGTYRYFGTDKDPLLKGSKQSTSDAVNPKDSANEGATDKTPEVSENSNSQVQTVERLKPSSSAFIEAIERTIANKISFSKTKDG